MSYKAVFQFILLFNDFKNVDLPNQGLATISASIYKQQKKKNANFAIPYQFPFQRNYKLNKKKIKEDAIIDDMFFRSKVIKIKYSDQQVVVDDFVQFRMQLQAFPVLNTQNVFLQLNLIYSNRYYASDTDKFDGKPVAQVRMRLKDIQNGLFSYAQADFKQDYFSKLSFVLYGQLMYYKFQKYQIKSKQPTSKQISRSEIENFGKLLIWSKQNFLSAGQDPFDLFYSNYVKNLRHSNYLTQTKINHFLNVKRKISMKLSKKYLQLIGLKGQLQVDQKIFRQYLESYKQPLSLEDIPQQIQQIRIDNFEYLNSMLQTIFHDQFDFQKMKSQYSSYVKQKLGQRVFKNTLYQLDQNYENAMKQNKKISKQMRNKNYSLTQYPIENQIFANNRDDHQFIFYEITLPQYMKERSQHSKEGSWQLYEGSKQSKQLNINGNGKNIDKKSFSPASKNNTYNLLNSFSATLQNVTNENQIKNNVSVNKNLESNNQKFRQNQHFYNEDQLPSDQQGSQSNNTQKSDTTQIPHPNQFFSQNDIKFNCLTYVQKNMLIVLCHGFQGSSYDMALIHKGIKAQLPNAQYLLSRKNQDDTQGDIQTMGQKLADQIKYYIRAYMDQDKVIINFVGHSMGGIISRASFKHLIKYRQQFGFYCSLSSPHLGYLNGVDNKIKAGLWFLRKWKTIKSLQQLSMQQEKYPRKTFLYKLSKIGTLKYFRKIIFFSSFQDSYVSWHSARASPHTSKNQDSKIEREMVQNILGLQNGKNFHTTIHRLDVNFNVKGNNIDSLIGRAAHINLIIQDSLFDVINTTLPKLFDLKEYKTGIQQQKQIIIGKSSLVKKTSNSSSKGKIKVSTLSQNQ